MCFKICRKPTAAETAGEHLIKSYKEKNKGKLKIR